MSTNPDPYAALRRVLALRPGQQRKLLRLVVRCERGRCTPVRVFGVRDGLLVQCRSDADVREMQERHPHLADWSRRRAFFLEEWLDIPAAERALSGLQVVCECDQTAPRLVDVQRLHDLASAATTRPVNATLPDVAAPLR